MSGSDQSSGSWEPLGLDAVVDIFSSASFRWWVSGGLALDLHVGRTWRGHEDTDVGVVRRDLGSVYALLSDWDVHVAAAGGLSPWRGEPLEVDRHQNNVWCRVSPGGPWVLDVTIGEGSDENWIYRRDPSVQVPWDVAVLRTTEGIPYLAPELQLLYKSEGLRPKDDVDAAEVIPSLDVRHGELLSRLLEPAHPWRRWFHSGRTGVWCYPQPPVSPRVLGRGSVCGGEARNAESVAKVSWHCARVHAVVACP